MCFLITGANGEIIIYGDKSRESLELKKAIVDDNEIHQDSDEADDADDHLDD